MSDTPTLTVSQKPKLEIPEPQKLDALGALKERATLMGISFSNNIGEDALRLKIKEHIEGKADEVPEAPKAATHPALDQETLPLNEVTDEVVLRRRIYEENMFLVRVRISNLNPAKKDIPGEYFTVHNKYLGTVRKYIPFGEATDNGYHIPKILYENLKARKFMQMRVKRNAQTGTSMPTSQWVKEFAIEEMPYLSKEEMDQLARQQAAAKGM